MALNLKPLPEFNPDGGVRSSLAARWRHWLSDFDTFLIASGIRDATRKRALLYIKQALKFEKFFTNLKMLELMPITIKQGTNLRLISSLKRISDMRYRNFAKPVKRRERHWINFIPGYETSLPIVNLRIPILKSSNKF